RIGSTLYSVVGVMPEGFRFPWSHRFWVPLRVDPTNDDRTRSPVVFVFGRLADDVTLARAQVELAALGSAAAAAGGEPRRPIRPVVTPFTRPFFDLSSP